MGVWIETHNSLNGLSPETSHPAWVCGLKHVLEGTLNEIEKSHPAWVCGLKLNVEAVNVTSVVTPCVGVWIETLNQNKCSRLWKSHPAWVCGLKLPKNQTLAYDGGHTLRGCVD